MILIKFELLSVHRTMIRTHFTCWMQITTFLLLVWILGSKLSWLAVFGWKGVNWPKCRATKSFTQTTLETRVNLGSRWWALMKNQKKSSKSLTSISCSIQVRQWDLSELSSLEKLGTIKMFCGFTILISLVLMYDKLLIKSLNFMFVDWLQFYVFFSFLCIF